MTRSAAHVPSTFLSLPLVCPWQYYPQGERRNLSASPDGFFTRIGTKKCFASKFQEVSIFLVRRGCYILWNLLNIQKYPLHPKASKQLGIVRHLFKDDHWVISFRKEKLTVSLFCLFFLFLLAEFSSSWRKQGKELFHNYQEENIASILT